MWCTVRYKVQYVQYVHGFMMLPFFLLSRITDTIKLPFGSNGKGEAKKDDIHLSCSAESSICRFEDFMHHRLEVTAFKLTPTMVAEVSYMTEMCNQYGQ